jgi:hypothetical protein
MATAKKPAAKAATKPPTARKKTTKRGPTKAAALKALGLTQDDLDTLKQVAEARKQFEADLQEVSERDAIGKQEYLTEDTTLPAEPTPASDESGLEPPGGWYMRNLGGTTRFRLSRQQKRGDKATELKPRGQRGDLAKLHPEDLQDPELITQVEYGLIEVITAAEAAEIIRKQATNQQAQTHPAMAALRNELGKPYEQHQIKIDPEFNSQGVTVAKLNPQGGEAGAIPDGFADAQPQALNDAQKDAIARRKDIHGPAAGLGGLQVTVAPTQRT